MGSISSPFGFYSEQMQKRGMIMKFSSLHTHTTYSDGKGSIRENIESAIRKNFVSLGISDHSYTACDESYCMMLSDYDDYEREVKELKKEYEGRMPLFLGLEKDYYSDVDKERYDYIISSVHYIIKDGICYPIDHTKDQQEMCIRDSFGGNVLDMAKCYYSMVVEAAEKCRPDIIGHFDVLNKFGVMPENDEAYRKIVLEAAREAAKYTRFFEVNTGAISRGYRTIPYPSDYVLEELNSLGVPLVLTSDCHHPDNLDFAYDVAVPIIKNSGYTKIYNLTENGFKEFDL